MLPLPSRTHPKKQNLVVYTKELTHLVFSTGVGGSLIASSVDTPLVSGN